ncbi:tRNA (guanosine(46)-N7)-methyltransferase TrmB [Saprospiraceae bacterium]|nr:tRNA (guanosine(46)-N7)-methyltransferase TrmB [Saprospiraceae bacterium]
MARNKLQKFAEVRSFPNVYENFHPMIPELRGENAEIVDMKGKWAQKHFENENPITLELACGRGEYTLQLARKYPDRNFIGVDIKGSRIHQGATIAIDEGLSNVAFLRMKIEKINNFIAADEISEIWITFPDPFLRESKANKRLTAPRYLDSYKKMLVENGIIQLKTDSPELYAFTHEILAEYKGVNLLYDNDDIYAKPLDFPDLEFKTYYEKKHLLDGRKIRYTRFTLDRN